QRQQAARFARIRQDVQQWADTLGISHEHLEESSFYATVCTALSAPHEQALSLALTVYWIYLLDDYLDRRDFAMLAAEKPRSARSALERGLDAVLAPLVAFLTAPRFGADEQSAGEMPGATDEATDETARDRDRLREALCSALGVLELAWATAPRIEAAMR